MSRKWFLLLACSSFALTADLNAAWQKSVEVAKELIQKSDYKKAISCYTAAIAEAPEGKRGELELALALAYYRDQEQQKAFECFLQALDHTKSKGQAPASSEDAKLFEEAFALYSNKNDAQPQQIAVQILQKYEKVVADHPDYYLLQFVVAASDGNLGRYDHFFEKFYASYERHPDHFLAHKMRAILQIKLLELGRTAEEKSHRRGLALASIEKALEKNSSDGMLYRLALALTSEQNEWDRATVFLKRMLENPTVISRIDICPYVQLAVNLGERELAQKIIDRSKELYAYSRSIATAQEYLNALRVDEKK